MFVLYDETLPEERDWIVQFRYKWISQQACVRLVRGEHSKSHSSFLREISAALQIGDDWGYNFNSLRSSMYDLEECKPFHAFVLHISSPTSLFSEQRLVNRQTIYNSFHLVFDHWWNEEEVPFFIRLECDHKAAEALNHERKGEFKLVSVRDMRAAFQSGQCSVSDSRSILTEFG